MYKISKPAGDSPWRVLMRNRLFYVFAVRVLRCPRVPGRWSQLAGSGTFPSWLSRKGKGTDRSQGQRHRREPRPPSETQVGVLERRGTEVCSCLWRSGHALHQLSAWALAVPTAVPAKRPGLACASFPVHAASQGLLSYCWVITRGIKGGGIKRKACTPLLPR